MENSRKLWRIQRDYRGFEKIIELIRKNYRGLEEDLEGIIED